MIANVWLIPLFPLLGFLINGLGRDKLSKSISGIIGSGTILGSFILSLLVFKEVNAAGFIAQTVHLFDFITVADLNIPFAFQVDQLTSLFLLIITGVGFLIHVYSTSYMHDDEGFQRYFAYLNLFVFSMLLLVLGSNYVIMFIGWEGVGLCSYLLIGFWFKNANYNRAAKKAFIMNRIGDLGFLLGIFLLIAQFGTVTYSEVFTSAKSLGSNDSILVTVTLLLFVGAMGKSAQIPLYTWLPDAMAGPTPVSALIHAATMVTAGIYMIARSNVLYALAPFTLSIVAFIGLFTALLAASIALKQNDIKKILAYSTVSQLGFMFLGLGVGAFTGAVFHVMTHAFFKALLFLGAGSVIHAMGGEQDIRKMGGLKLHMKTTHWTFLVGCLAIAGIPGLSGFFSKDEILAHTYASSSTLYVFALGAALMTAFYMFRLYYITFSGKFRGTHAQEHHLHESPKAMTIPLVILAVLAIVGGYVGMPEVFHTKHFLAEFLAPVFEGSVNLLDNHELSHSTEWLLMGGSVALIIGVIFYAKIKFSNYQFDTKPQMGFAKVLENKWYVDELYNSIIVTPLHKISAILNDVFEKYIVDGLVNGVGKGIDSASGQLRKLQTGHVGFYFFAIVISMVALLAMSLLM